jgi:glycosyltransferase involved in cell wall biosynthesis
MSRGDEAMRIVHAVNNGADSTLGTEKRVTNLAVAQKARGSEVMIVIDRQGSFTKDCQDQGIPVIAQRELSRPAGGLAATPEENAVQGFIQCIQVFDPDIVHCHSASAALVGIAAGNLLGVPCVLTGAGSRFVIQARESGLRFAVTCETAASSERMKNEVLGLEAYYVPPGTRAVPPVSAQPGSVAPVSLIMAGSLIARKGIDIAILAMVALGRRLGQDRPVLNIYGDGEIRKYLTEITAVLELDDVVRFHGFKLGALERCPSTDILIMPSRQELAPLVILEAMSRGMPIVATDVGDVTNMLPDRRYGRVIPTDSVAALAEAIESLLTDIARGQFNPDLLVERHRSLYSTEKFAENMEAVYDQVLLNNSAPARQSADGR